MHSLYERIKSNKFVAAVLTLMTGTAVGQAIPLLASPILTRLYTPQQYGEYGLVVACYSILVILGTLRLDHAVVVQSNNRSSQYLIHSVFISAIFFSLITLLFFFLAQTLLKDTLSLTITMLSGIFIALFTFICSMNLVFNSHAIRLKRYKVAAKSKVMLFSIAVGAQVVLGYSESQSGLLIGQLMGLMASAAYLSSYSLSFKKGPLYYFSFTGITYHTSKNRAFLLYAVPFSLINALSRNAPILFLVTMFGKEFAGYYTLATMLVLAPMGVISTSISQVYYREAAGMAAIGKSISGLTKSLYINQIKYAALPCIILVIIAPWAFSYIFGEFWIEAGVYVRILMPWLFMIFLNTPIMTSVYVNENQSGLLRYEIILLILRVLVLGLGALFFNDPRSSIAAFSVVSFFMQIYLSYFLFSNLESNK